MLEKLKEAAAADDDVEFERVVCALYPTTLERDQSIALPSVDPSLEPSPSPMGPAYKHRSTTSVCMPARCHGSCTLMKAYENVSTLPMLFAFVVRTVGFYCLHLSFAAPSLHPLALLARARAAT